MVLFLSFIYKNNADQEKCHFACAIVLFTIFTIKGRDSEAAKKQQSQTTAKPKISKSQPLRFSCFHFHSANFQFHTVIAL